MTHFGEALLALLRLEEKTQSDLAAASGVDQTLISRMVRGKIPSRDQLGRLVAAISFDRQRRLELLLAHLRDEAKSVHGRAGLDGRHYVLMAVGDMPDNKLAVPHDLLDDVTLVIEEAAQNEDMRSIIQEWARLIRRHRDDLIKAHAAAADKNQYQFSNDEPLQAVAEGGSPAAAAFDSEMKDALAREAAKKSGRSGTRLPNRRKSSSTGKR